MQAKLVASATSNLWSCQWSGARSGSGGETDSGYQGCGFSSVAQLLNAYQVKADGTTGDYRFILTTQSCTVHVRMTGKRNIHV